jgi:glutathione synthase/RimK-type ligase-like ATP-grasp enzyme
MGIRLVYGLKTADDAWLQQFYPSRRLAEAADALGYDYAATIHQQTAPIERTCAFCRGHVAILRGELPEQVYHQLEAEGTSVVNPAAATILARDKLVAAGFFNQLGTAHPLTRLADLRSSYLPLPVPFVAKPRHGKMGRGVALINTRAEWDAYRDGLTGDDDILAQELVSASIGTDIRFFFARQAMSVARNSGTDNSQAADIPVICVMRSGQGFLSNAHAGATMSIYSPPASLLVEARRIFKASGLLYGTVDFLFSNHQRTEFTVCEMNGCPGFEELERATGIDMARAIIMTAASLWKRR